MLFTRLIVWVLLLLLPNQVFAKETIVVASSLPMTGNLSHIGKGLMSGAQVYFDYINESQGGVYNRQIITETLDDQYDPKKTIRNTLSFIKSKDVDLLFSYVGTEPVKQILPLLKKYSDEHLFLFFPYTGALPHRVPPYDDYVFNLRPSYEQEVVAIIDLYLKEGYKNIAMFYQMDGYGRSAHYAANQYLKTKGLSLVTDVAYQREMNYQDQYIDQANIIKQSNADAVIAVATYEASAGFIRDLKNLGYDAPVATLSFAASQGVLSLLNKESKVNNKEYTDLVVFSEVLPNIQTRQDLKAVKLFNKLMNQRGELINSISFEGFLNAYLLVETLKQMGPEFDPSMLPNAFYDLGPNVLGIQDSIKLDKNNDNQALDMTYQYQFKNNRFIPAFKEKD